MQSTSLQLIKYCRLASIIQSNYYDLVLCEYKCMRVCACACIVRACVWNAAEGEEKENKGSDGDYIPSYHEASPSYPRDCLLCVKPIEACTLAASIQYVHVQLLLM